MGAVIPSGPLLTRALALTAVREMQGRDGHVIELGAGTGEVTKALLAAGIAPDRLALVERDPELVAFLRRHFRGPRIIEGDAARLPGFSPPRVSRRSRPSCPACRCCRCRPRS